MLSVADLYIGLASTAARLLTKYGQTVTLSRETSGTFNPVLGSYASPSATSWTGKGAAFNYNKNEVDGTQIRADDLRLTLEAVSTPPITGDTVTVNGIDYTAVGVTTTSPGGTVVKYDVQLRR